MAGLARSGMTMRRRDPVKPGRAPSGACQSRGVGGWRRGRSGRERAGRGEVLGKGVWRMVVSVLCLRDALRNSNVCAKRTLLCKLLK